MKYTYFLILVVLLFSFTNSSAQSFEEVSDIIYNKCSVCHRPGEIGPMSFTNYNEVRDWADMIKHVTEIKYMPPWKPDPKFSKLLDESHLTDDEIQLIADWVEAGAPQGDATKEAMYPEFTQGSLLGEPDLVLSFAQSHVHKGNNKDEYRWFVLPSGLAEDKIVKAVEFRPGNTKIVHHALIFEDTKGIAREQDELTPEYGYQGFGSFAGDGSTNLDLLTAKQFAGYAPGDKARFSPDGIGQVLKAGADIAVQLHYAPWHEDEPDSSSINFFFADDTEQVDRKLQSHLMVPLPGVLVNRPFFINASEVFEFHGIWEVPRDLSLFGIAPHMHLLGKNWTVYLERPDGTRENLIHIPDWDFNWQSSYYFPNYIVAPKGSKVHAFATYDNTVNNPNNPNNPPKFMTWGEKTEDEMYYLPIFYTEYEEGDENISFESSTTPTEEINFDQSYGKLLPIAPNPVNNTMQIDFQLDRAQAVSINLLNVQGQLLRNIRSQEFFSKGPHAINLQTGALSSGLYYLQLYGNGVHHITSFVKAD